MSSKELIVAEEAKLLFEAGQQPILEPPTDVLIKQPQLVDKGPFKRVGLRRVIDTTEADVAQVLAQQRVIEQSKLKKEQEQLEDIIMLEELKAIEDEARLLEEKQALDKLQTLALTTDLKQSIAEQQKLVQDEFDKLYQNEKANMITRINVVQAQKKKREQDELDRQIEEETKAVAERQRLEAEAKEAKRLNDLRIA